MMSKYHRDLVSALSKVTTSLQGRTPNKKAKKTMKVARTMTPIYRSPRFAPQPKMGLLAGYGGRVSSRFSSRSHNDTLRVSGLDLLNSPVQNFTNISFFASANPITWTGTKIAGIALAYQNYRPIRFRIHYRPQVGSTVSYSLFIGTIWQGNTITSREAIEPTLLTSPGGAYVPAWQPVSSDVPLGSRLPMRMFPVRDSDLTFTPFCVVCRAGDHRIGADDTVNALGMPGRIFVEYEYEFSNPIGSGFSSNLQQDAVVPVTLYDTYIYSGSKTFLLPGMLSSTSGWLVDMKREPSPEWPLFSHLTTDMFMGPMSEGVSTLVQMFTIKLNGKIPPPISSTTTVGSLEIELYTGNPPDIPVSPAEVRELPSSSSSSAPPIDDVEGRIRSFSAPRASVFQHPGFKKE